MCDSSFIQARLLGECVESTVRSKVSLEQQSSSRRVLTKRKPIRKTSPGFPKILSVVVPYLERLIDTRSRDTFSTMSEGLEMPSSISKPSLQASTSALFGNISKKFFTLTHVTYNGIKFSNFDTHKGNACVITGGSTPFLIKEIVHDPVATSIYLVGQRLRFTTSEALDPYAAFPIYGARMYQGDLQSNPTEIISIQDVQGHCLLRPIGMPSGKTTLIGVPLNKVSRGHHSRMKHL